MQKFSGFPSLVGSTSTAMKAANPKPSSPSDAGGSSYGSFTAEKLVREQASVKTGLEMAHTILRRTAEQINLLEGKLQQAVIENVNLKVKQNEDSKLWQGLHSKISSTKTLCDQLTETLQQIASQTEQAEEDKKFFEEMFGKNSKALDEFNCLLHDLSTKLEFEQQKIISDSLIKQLEGLVDENNSRLICLDSRLQCMEQELKLKDDVCISLKENLASSESEKNNLELRNQSCIIEIVKLCKDNKDLNELLGSFMAKVTELDKEHASMSGHMSRLLRSFERFYEMIQEEKMLVARSSKDKFEHLQQQYVDLSSENNALKIEIEELKSRIIELQKTQEIVMVQHVEECQVAEDKIRRLESEAEISASNISRLEKLASEHQGRIQKLLEESTLAENHKQELLIKILKLESDNQELQGQVQSIIEEKSNNAESLQGEITKRDQQVDTLKNQINQLRCVLNEKEQLYSCSLEREKTLEDQKLQVARIQQDNELKESTLRAYHKEELQRIQSKAENELWERLSLLRKEHEVQIQSLRMQHEEECQRMQEELELQKSKEEKQRALLQLQWKVMGENQQVDQEVNSKKDTFLSEEELDQCLLDWLDNPDTIKYIKEVNIEDLFNVEELLQNPVKELYFLTQLEKFGKDENKFKRSYNGFRWHYSHIKSGRVTRKYYQIKEKGQIVNNISIVEFTKTDGPKDKVLIKVKVDAYQASVNYSLKAH